MAGHDLGDLLEVSHVGKALGKIGAVPVSTEAHHILAAYGQVVVHVGEDVFGGSGAGGGVHEMGRAEADAHDTAQLLDGREMAVAEVAGVRVEGMGIGVGGDKRLAAGIGDGQKIVHRLLGGVGDIGDDTQLKATLCHSPTKVGKTVIRVVRAADAGVPAPQKGEVTDTEGVQLIQPLELTCRQTGILHGQDGGVLACLDGGLQLGTARHLHCAIRDAGQFFFEVGGGLQKNLPAGLVIQASVAPDGVVLRVIFITCCLFQRNVTAIVAVQMRFMIVKL